MTSADQDEIDCFVQDVHVNYILSLKNQKESLESCMTEHMRMSGVYWGVTSMALLGREHEMDHTMVVEWVLKCQHESGGFSGNIRHDPHLLYTCHAILLLATFDALDRIDAEKTSRYVAALQQSDGSFGGDQWLEIDTKFTYCALSVLSILKHRHLVDIPLAMEYIAKCQNFDGGFGNLPGCESHGGHIFTATGSLALGLDVKRHNATAERLGWWLCERQCDSGGLNGRPEKQADVCYSWWNISSLIILGKLDWINKEKLIQFILNCQDVEDGGISDRPGNVADVYHTFFGIGGLSLLGYFDDPKVLAKHPEYKRYKRIHPVYAIPEHVVERLQLESEILST